MFLESPMTPFFLTPTHGMLVNPVCSTFKMYPPSFPYCWCCHPGLSHILLCLDYWALSFWLVPHPDIVCSPLSSQSDLLSLSQSLPLPAQNPPEGPHLTLSTSRGLSGGLPGLHHLIPGYLHHLVSPSSLCSATLASLLFHEHIGMFSPQGLGLGCFLSQKCSSFPAHLPG